MYLRERAKDLRCCLHSPQIIGDGTETARCLAEKALENLEAKFKKRSLFKSQYLIFLAVKKCGLIFYQN